MFYSINISLDMLLASDQVTTGFICLHNLIHSSFKQCTVKWMKTAAKWIQININAFVTKVK